MTAPAYRLSEFDGSVAMQVVRDGPFSLTGKLSTPLDGLCVPLRSEKFAAAVNENPRVSAVITYPHLVEHLDARLAVAIAEQPEDAHADLHAICAGFAEAALRERPNRIDSSAVIDPMASIAACGVRIGPGVHVGPFVRVSPGVTIETGCVLHSGVVLGGPGFNTGIIDGRQRIFPQVGGVRLQANVELLGNVTVARALFGGETTIGEEVCVDNLTYIAHDVVVGRRALICAHATVLGRVAIGDEAYLGPSATIMNGLTLGARCKISMGAVVTRDVSEGQRVTGNFAIPHQAFLTHLRTIRQA